MLSTWPWLAQCCLQRGNLYVTFDVQFPEGRVDDGGRQLPYAIPMDFVDKHSAARHVYIIYPATHPRERVYALVRVPFFKLVAWPHNYTTPQRLK